MPTIPVSQIKIGQKLSENVITKHGNILFNKGKELNERDIEILKAFLVPSVRILSKGEVEEVQEEKPEEETVNVVPPIYMEYDRMFKMLKKTFTAVSTGQNLSILDIRTQLERLVHHIDSYNVLTFMPRVFHINDYLYHNSVLVALTAYKLAKWHDIPQKDWFPIAMGGLFHDIGNTRINNDILTKPDRLTAEELEEMRKHTVLGYNYLKGVAAINEGVKLTALQHHEREDGSGYPLGVSGDKIHKYAKVIAIADIYHAMTSQRNHKKAASPYLVLEQLFHEAFGKLDPALVQTFINKATQIGIGSLVKLSDNRIGEIVFTDRDNPTRPWVKVNGTIVNLSVERKLYIQDLIRT